MAEDIDSLLQPPSNDDFPILERTPSSYNPLHTYDLAKGDDKHYQQQYADMYFTRLAVLRKPVEKVALEAWEGFELAGENAKKFDRVLAVRQGQLCWIVGTIYMEMPLKPNVLDDISKEHWIAAPPPRAKFTSPDGQDKIMLEDESGRVQLTGAFLSTQLLVTGCIVAVLGTENQNGEFEVIDLKFAELPVQPERWARDPSLKKEYESQQNGEAGGGKLAIVSGLSISSDSGDAFAHELLVEYLLGEATGPHSQASAANISRLLIAGNSISHGSPIPSREDMAAKRKKYGYDPTAYNAAPTERLDNLIATLLPSIPVTILPGETDPANVSLPQQSLHPALFPHSRAYSLMPGEASQEPSWFDSVTNPWQGDIDGWRIMATGGQTVDDVFKYVEGEDRLEMMGSMLRWRLVAPTAPDTLWSYPFQMQDAFIISECPHIYVVGNQPKFDTAIIDGPNGQRVRLIAVPKFQETGELVLLDTESLNVEVIKFALYDKN
ncbi:MAG: hypothetical protein M1821_001103 [Bathelium mastoideum]|nr:MAG: hypothetical protein M1821_001103 [Bathelium mastoideum]KAI9693869.1 MAG: hypothetical protein M1822_003140 [Bathelium mastoideum]